MQRPHESLLEQYSGFAELYPRLDKGVRARLLELEDVETKAQIDELTRQWAKLKILWDELQILLSNDKNKDFTKALALHTERKRSEDDFQANIGALGIPKDEIFIPEPSNIDQRLQILSDMLASAVNEKLEMFHVIRDDQDESSLANLKRHRDEEIEEYENANRQILDQITELMMSLYKDCSDTLMSHTSFLDSIEHGSIERFTNAYLQYHELATSALLKKISASIAFRQQETYSPGLVDALTKHYQQMERSEPKLEARLAQVNQEIGKYEVTRTPEYVAAIEEYHTLKAAIEQAEKDVDKLSHYKTRKG